MLKFSVDKKILERATALLNQVAGLKSTGSTPSETSGLILTPATLSVQNMNEANGVLIEQIPITILGGNVADHLEFMYMVNTKKLDSIVKGSGATVYFVLEEGKLTIGEDKRRYELAMFNVARKEAEEVKMLGYTVAVKDVVKNLEDTTYITENARNSVIFSSALFTGSSIMASDRTSALYIEKGGLFGSGVEDLMIAPDLFAACLAKVQATEAEPGFTEDGRRFILKFDNVTLYKTLTSETFPKAVCAKTIQVVKDVATTGARQDVVSAVIDLQDFKTKLKELHSIIEAESYHLSYHRDGSIQIYNNNVKGGADGRAFIDAQVTMPDGVGDVITAVFTYTHLSFVAQLFPLGSVKLFGVLDDVKNGGVIKWVAVYTEDKSYFFIPQGR